MSIAEVLQRNDVVYAKGATRKEIEQRFEAMNSSLKHGDFASLIYTNSRKVFELEEKYLANSAEIVGNYIGTESEDKNGLTVLDGMEVFMIKQGENDVENGDIPRISRKYAVIFTHELVC